jgi:hypothetical protein
MFTVAALVGAPLIGATWRRWFGSARPKWMEPIDAWWRARFDIQRPDRGAPYRRAQIFIGCVVLFLLCWANGDQWWRAGLETAAAMVIFTISAHTRDPFIWIAEKLRLPSMWGTMLNGPGPWGEALQGACLWMLATIL